MRVRPRRLLAASAAAAAVLLGAAAPALAAEAPGSIAGVLTEVTTHTPLAGIQVCAEMPPPPVANEEEEPPEAPPTCATTSSSGAYTIAGLAPASYWVIFNPPASFLQGAISASHPNYVAEAYEDAQTEAAAKKVAVASGGAVTGIDATLERGGEISGRVSAGAGGAPIPAATVCALGVGSEALIGHIGCTTSGAAGEYAIDALGAGSYDLFFAAAGYTLQVYDGHNLFSEANPVSLAAGQVVGGVDAALATRPPRPTPSEATPRSTSTGPGLVPAGSLVSERSPLTLRSRMLAVRAGRTAELELACRGSARCRGRVVLTALARVGVGHRRHVTLGSATFDIAGGAHATIAIHLDREGRSLLALAHGHLAGRLTVTLEGAVGAAPQLLAVRLGRARRVAGRP
ncbi:MAG TPA: carboxypeptidase-like regulatory domain-containing protein [Solirubrobacteraceae bacterium]|nr:carboxypeptidase-like regulatory domain-containing protein [Solirubrobacteraceae bacterium]